MAARTVEGEHQLAARALAKRVVPDERLELADELGRAPLGQLCVDALFDGSQAQLFEARGLVLGERLVGEVAERRTSPELERFADECGSPGRLRLPCLAHQLLEAVRVDRGPLEPEAVSR